MTQIKTYFTYAIWWIGLACLSCVASILISISSHFSLLLPLKIYHTLCHCISRWSFMCLNITTTSNLSLPKDAHFIITANHQSFADIPLLISILAKHHIYPRFIMKHTINYIPCIGNIARKLKFLAIQRDQPRKILRQIKEASQQDSTLPNWLIFPEGTRTKPGQINIPKSAGLYWLFSTNPEHQWLDFTILYQKTTVKFQTNVLPRPDNNIELEKTLQQLWQAKPTATESNP